MSAQMLFRKEKGTKIMNLSLGAGVSGLTVFFQGLLSFFSPCVLPLLPIYIGYLAGGAKSADENGDTVYRRGRVLLNTLFFIIGVSFAFFVLGFGFSAAGKFFSGNRQLLSQIGGVLVILFGLYQLGLFGGRLLSRERRLPLRLDRLAMNPGVALVFGFTFSFAWTPCVGPALTSVLLMASSAETSATGFVLIGVYTLGFTLPFLAVGLFTKTLLDLFRRHQNVVRYTVKVGGALLILMGILMVTGTMNSLSGYLSGTSAPAQGTTGQTTPQDTPAADAGTDGSAGAQTVLAPDFTLLDQFGNEHTLSDYQGKTVFLNFWATWCGYCKEEMPDLQQLYLDHGENTGDVIILGIAAPGAGDVSEEEIAAFLSENGYTYPTLMDTTGAQFGIYGASGLPTTYLIDTEGNVFGYVAGMLSREMMDDAILQAQAHTAG